LKSFSKEAILAPAFVFIDTVCELILPLLMARIIDVGVKGGGGVSCIIRFGIYMLLLSVVALLTGVLSTRYASIASQGFGRNLRKALFDKIQDFSFADIDRFSSASLITRMTNDVNSIQMTIGMGLRMFVRALVMIVVSVVVCIFIDARLTLILLVVMPLMSVAIFFLMRACLKLFTVFQQKIDALNDAVQENLISIRVVKAFVRGNYERQKFKKSNNELRRAGLNASMRMVLMNPIMMFSMNLACMAVLWFGGRQVAGGTMLTGSLYSFFTYISMVLMSALMVAFTLMQITRAAACAKRILEVLGTVPDIRDTEESRGLTLPAPEGKIEFKDVSFKYLATGTGDDVLRGVSFSIEPGQFVALIGGTGTGKSSLVNLIPRFYDVTGGQILVDGLDVRDYPLEQLRGRIGMVLQNNVLFSGTVRENLLWGNPNATEEQIVQAAKDAQAYDFIMQMPQGFDTELEQGGVNVSGGQKQRLCIARAMLRHPAILILDDSTSAVDSATEAEIRKSFYENLRDTTVIIIAQRISSVRSADKIIVLEDDHVAAEGTHEELMQGSAIYREIYQSQQEGVLGHV
jgi:ATP-binding cassette subfamily B protein